MTTESRRVSAWVPFSHVKEIKPVKGDCIEFNRGYYSHWAIMTGTAENVIMHFNPANAAEAVSPLTMNAFMPGKVTLADLGEIAGSSKIRVNNKPGFMALCRPHEQIDGIRKILVNKPGFFYSLEHFNCEHFVTHVKFGKSSSDQMNTIEGIMTLGLATLNFGNGSREDLFHFLATLQWAENIAASHNKRTPRNILRKGITDWENA